MARIIIRARLRGWRGGFLVILCLFLLALGLTSLLYKRPSSFLTGFSIAMITSPQVGSAFVITCGPVFNQFPVSYQPHGYADWPLIDGRNATKGSAWSNSQVQHDRGIEVDPGDLVEIAIYFHNGLLEFKDCQEDDAYRTIIQASAEPSLGQTAFLHSISGSIRAINTSMVSSSSPGKGGDLIIRIKDGQPRSLVLVPGSVQEVHIRRGVKEAPFYLPDWLFDQGVDLGTIFNGRENDGFVVFQLKVSN
jgi:hypothetical protein